MYEYMYASFYPKHNCIKSIIQKIHATFVLLVSDSHKCTYTSDELVM